jgi:hypothetical protein
MDPPYAVVPHKIPLLRSSYSDHRGANNQLNNQPKLAFRNTSEQLSKG